jgi:hypothetical protein
LRAGDDDARYRGSDFLQRPEWAHARNRAREQQDISATADDSSSYQ